VIGPGGARTAAAALAALVALSAGRRPARADAPGTRVVIDRTVVRFHAPETGGTAHPRFIGERMLAFEARLAVLAERPDGLGDGYDERQVREALEHHVAEDILASLAHRLIAGSTARSRPSEAELERVEQTLTAAFLERLGGRARVDGAAAAEQIDPAEVDAVLHRQALAAWYIDRAMTPVLEPTDEQLREVFRTSAHPFRGQPYERVRAALQRWFVLERLRVAESAFFQAARARMTVVVTP